MQRPPQRISYSLFPYRFFQSNFALRVLSKKLFTLVLIIAIVLGTMTRSACASTNSLDELEKAVETAKKEYFEAQRKAIDADRNAKKYIKKKFSGKDAAIILAQWGPLMAQIIASGINPVVVLGAIQNLILGEILDQMRITPDKAALLGELKAVVEAYKEKLKQLDEDIIKHQKDIKQKKKCMEERKEVVSRVNKKLYEDNVYKKARQELEKAEKAAQLAINARLATQAAQNQANQAVNQCASLSREIKQQLEISASIGKKCNDAKKALSKVDSASKTAKTTLNDMASCYGTSKSQWKAACKAAARLESISQMTQSEIESVNVTAKKAASAARDAAIECSKKAGSVSASYAEAQAANEKVMSILAQIEQIRTKISNVSGKLKNLSDFVNKASGEVDKVKNKPGEAAGYAKDAEAAIDKVTNILKGREKEEKAKTIIQGTKTASQKATKAAKDAKSSFSSASKTINNAKKSLKSLEGQAAKLAKVKTGCDVGSGDMFVTDAQATKDTAEVFAEGADENANTAENCAKFVSIALANRKGDKDQEDDQGCKEGYVPDGKGGCKPPFDSAHSVFTDNAGHHVEPGVEVYPGDGFSRDNLNKDLDDKLKTLKKRCTDYQCKKDHGSGWKCNEKTGECEKEKRPPQADDGKTATGDTKVAPPPPKPPTKPEFKCKSNQNCWTHYNSNQYYCNKGTGKCIKCPPGSHGKKDGTAACCFD